MVIPELSKQESYQLAVVVFIWVITFIFIRYFHRLMKHVEAKSAVLDLDRRTFRTLDNILDTLAVILAFSLSLSVLGITGLLYTTLTAFGVIAIIIGMAVDDLASNIFAGLMMIFNPAFLEGESIEVEKFAGTVEKISLRMTILRRSDGVLLTIPNSYLMTRPIINYSAAQKRRVDIVVGVANENDIEEALTLMKKAATDQPGILDRDTVNVVMSDVKEYAVDLILRFWVHPDHLRNTSSDVLRAITESFKKNNIELAVPLRKYV